MDGDWEAGPLYAGTSAALIRRIESVADILSRIATEAERALVQAHSRIKRLKQATSAP